MKVHNSLGPGLREMTYENAMCVEMRYQGIANSQQSRYPVYHCGELVDEYAPDLIVDCLDNRKKYLVKRNSVSLTRFRESRYISLT